jgi:hypothetical protein
MSNEKNSLSASHREALLVALLCVNHFSLEAGWALLEGLRREGLTNPVHASRLGIADAAAALERAGYRRGRINEIVAPRVVALMKAVEAGSLSQIVNLVVSRREKEFAELVQNIWGFGPTAAANAWLLLTPAPAR